MKIEIELIPAPNWGLSGANILSKYDWSRVRKAVINRAKNECEICGISGILECHEVFTYDDINCVQKLTKIRALCKLCHSAKHPNRIKDAEYKAKVSKHFQAINKIDTQQNKDYSLMVNRLWKERSQKDWIVDLSVLKHFCHTNTKLVFFTKPKSNVKEELMELIEKFK
jgi:hypothetical protein